MEKLSLQHLVARTQGNRGCLKAIKTLILFLLFCCFGHAGYAAVSVTPGTNGTLICNSKALGGTAPAFTTLGNITIVEGNNADFTGSASATVVDVITLRAPTGWQFNTTLPTFTYVTGSNVTAVSGSISATTLTINISVNNFNGADAITISGLQVQATSTVSAPGYIYAQSISGVAGIVTGTSGTNFGSLSLVAMSAPSVSIAASPSGPICPGTSVTYTPAPVNGGSTPTYQWFLNSASASAGATYTTSALGAGSTVYCIMTSSSNCVTPLTATSNTVTTVLNAVPAPITGAMYTCPSTTTSLSDVTAGGTWSSTNTAVATVNSSGVVSGVVPGTATISYTAGGCAATSVVYINASPAAPVLTPTVSAVCNNGAVSITASGTPLPTAILSETFNSGLGSWTVDNTGSIGVLPGAEWKSCGDGYINEQGLYHSADNSAFVMANSDTSGSTSYTSTRLISPSFSLVGYSSATLSFQQSYAYWPSGDFNVNLEVSTNGGSSWTTIQNFAGANIGTLTTFNNYSFSLNSYLGQPNVMIRFYYYCHWGYYWAVDNVFVTGTSATQVPSWSPVTHLFTDAGFTTPYTAGTQTSTVYVHPTTVTSTTIIPYIASASIPGCATSRISTVTINPQPAAITGVTNVCVGTTSVLSDPTTGGTWSSLSPAVATVGASSGIVTGVAIGNSTIFYTLSTGCSITANVSVTATPAAIAGNLNVCFGSTSSLSDYYSGGTWVSSNPAVATVGVSSGVVSGLTLGTATITYTLGVGCSVTAVVTVQPLPAAITGTTSVCMTQVTSLANTTTGGTWTTSSPFIASVGAGSGAVTGISAGTVGVTYTLSTGCNATTIVSVNPLAPITGNLNLCVGFNTSLSNANSGGTWTSSNPAAATIGASSGVILGVAAGTSIVSYVLSTGCAAVAIVTVNTLPAAITGTTVVCAGLTTTLADAVTGGTWTSNSTAIASVGLSSGIVTGVSQGTTIITYTITSTGCIATTIYSVNPVAPVTGTLNVCAGLTTTLANALTGGTWTSGNTAIATVGAASGVVQGVAAGTAVITYTLATGCISTAVVVVNPLPGTITGTASVCVGLTSSLATTSTGGTWSSSTTAYATVGAGTGVVTGVAAGLSFITYTLPTGCITTTLFNVNPLPAPVSGTLNVCAGLTTTLFDASGSGTWISNTPAVAGIGLSSGIINGVVAGTTVITFTLPTGCKITTPFTVNPLPPAITGTAAVCAGLTTTLANATTGGTWSSSNTAIATTASGPGGVGIISGIVAGNATITYTIGTGCIATTIVTVNPLPNAISGTASVCVGSVTSLSDALTGGTWLSSNPSFATITTGPSGGGVVSGIAAGNTTITYTLPTGCLITQVLTVNPLPAAITGFITVCQTQSTLLGNTSTGGTWSSSNPAIASIGATVGAAYGVSTGIVDITYTLPTGCIATTPLTVNPLPAAISGTATVCVGLQVSLTDAATGGSWSSTNALIAGVGAGSGVVTGVGAGTASIIYTLPTGCSASIIVTVYSVPTAISGSSNACVGSVITLSNATTGGTWSSPGATAILAVGAASGIVSALGPGTAVVTYSLPTGCIATKAVTVNALPAAIVGGGNLCQAYTTTLTDATPGGLWNSSNASIASVGLSTGIVTGNAPGTATITYTVISSGCIALTSMSISPTPSAITGVAEFCSAVTTTLSNAVSGGTWSSANTTIATIGSSTGIVSGVAGGTAVISYTLSAGCGAAVIVTVNPSPTPIIGSANICVGNTFTYTDASPGGTWSSSNIAIVTIDDPSGLAIGIAAGNAAITYAFPSGCAMVLPVTVYPLPAAITGTTTLCSGFTAALNDATPGGTWSSANTVVATVNATTGGVTGVSSGTAVISYTLATGCAATRVMSVSQSPSVISGAVNVCQGLTTTMTNTVAGGTWTSNNAAVASINAVTGVVTGTAPGTAVIIYTLPSGCLAVLSITVNPLPAPITGTTVLCAGNTTTLNDATTGGTWSSSNAAVATIGSSSGVLTAVGAGTTTITYVLSLGCAITKVVSVNPLPAAITGPSVVCIGSSATMSSTAGGTFTSSNVSIATINGSTGLITGTGSGTVTITYTLSTGCFVTTIVTINTIPSITGTAAICMGATTTLANTATGGTWVTTNVAVADVGLSTGVVSGISVATATVSYVLSVGCVTSRIVTVNPLPAAISGTAGLCIGVPATMASTTTGGTWTSSNTSVASISSGGVVSGLIAGTTTIIYTLSTGCAAAKLVSVYPIPAAIDGSLAVCVGLPATLTDATTGGTWSSTDVSIATIDAVTGIASGLLAGTATISYTLGGSCTVTAVLTVNPLPAPIAGTLTVCTGLLTVLSDAATGGTWVTSAPAIATVTTSSGVVAGITAGTSGVTYTLPTGCIITAIVTVNTTAPITGTTSVCVGSSVTLSDTTSSGTWSSGSAVVATVGASSGIVTGIASGGSVITYTAPTGCIATANVIVYPLPAPITGIATVCAGLSTTLADASAGGTWASGNPAIATIGSTTGIVSGLLAGTSVITYTLSTGCIGTRIVTVNPLPEAISGPASLCTGLTITLADATPDGTWSSSNLPVAAIGVSSGIVSGISAGTAVITYKLATGCITTAIVTVSTLLPITGVATVCQGLSTTLSNAVAGGEWTSVNPLIASVGALTGVVTGVAAGTTTIAYNYGAGCTATRIVTVYPLGPISGFMGICVGTTSSMTDAVPGGTWSSSNPSVATIGAASGVVSALISGTSTITYSLPTGCQTTTVVTVYPLTAITGTTAVCAGSATSLSNATTGGYWSADDPAVAYVDITSGVLSGIGAGTTIVTYLLPTGCFATTLITVHPLPAAITGTPGVCVGLSTVLSSAPATGIWSSSNAAVASVGAVSGITTGVGAGIAVITYKLSTGCLTSVSVTVNPLPSGIAGTPQVCAGLTTALTNASPGGTWSSSNASVAVIDVSSGLVTGVSAGTAIITYTLGTGCITTRTITVNPLPAAITGSTVICMGFTTSLSSTTPGGSWSSDNMMIATIGPSSGVVTSVVPGTAGITYTLPTGCLVATGVTVNPLPAVITGTAVVCVGATTTLANATIGGSWSSSNVARATIDAATGVVSGIVAGTVTITYTLGTGCIATTVLTVQPLPATIAGTTGVCAGLTTSLTSTTSGGVWSMPAPAGVATISVAGVVTAVSAGTAIVSYTLPTGCAVFTTVTVYPLPLAITGTTTVCAGLSTTLSDAVAGGTWSSSSPTAAIGSTTGVLMGITPGTAIVTYTLGTGCITTVAVSVSPSPATISGPAHVCLGLNTVLASATASGTWSSSNPAIATVGLTTGTVTGIAAGTVTITYLLSNGCAVYAPFTVNPLPAAITGAANICQGLTVTLSNASPGGTWSSSSPAVAAVDPVSGIVTGLSAGGTGITYTLPTGCIKTSSIAVYPLPSAISGTLSICATATTTLTSATSGGVWTTGIPSVATIGAATGVLSGVGAGTTTVYYTLGTGCSVSAVATINAMPDAITGSTNACLGTSTTLANATTGGVWSSSSAHAVIGAATGIITGISLGTAIITYMLPTGCKATIGIIVNPVPAPITGTTHACQGYTSLLASATAGGSWSTGSSSIATAATSGNITAVSAGTTGITYALPTGCMATTTFSVDPLSPITGITTLCIGDVVTLSTLVPGGIWSSSTFSVAGVGSGTGITTGNAPGTSVITYLLATGCVATITVTVNPVPVAYIVTGGGSYCAGSGGVHIGVNGSNTGISYQLYLGSVAVGSPIVGTGSPIDFGIFTTSGTYTIRATNTITGCGRLMYGSAAVTTIPYGPPYVSIASPTGDTLCTGASTTFTAVPTYGGSAPVYQWQVNGITVGTGNTYTYTAVDGDIISCRLTSSAGCLSVDTATGYRSLAVIPNLMPSATILALPGSSVCAGSPVSFTASAANGGSAPFYQWLRNGVVSDSGTTYSFIPVDGDVVFCRLASSYQCRLADTVISPSVTVTVTPLITPLVTINATPGLSVMSGDEVTFAAEVTNAGTTPAYQWFINGVAVSGSTNSTYVSSSLADQDTVACLVTSSGLCGGIGTFQSVIINVGNVGVSVVAPASAAIRIIPNPNNGTFTLSGRVTVTAGESVHIAVINMLGHVVLSRDILPHNGVINEQFSLPANLSNGTYTLSVTFIGNKIILPLVKEK